jgi:hypothetical protein
VILCSPSYFDSSVEVSHLELPRLHFQQQVFGIAMCDVW